ncbi:MAG: MmgE/PrpD family protein [Dehalobacterium sp.]
MTNSQTLIDFCWDLKYDKIPESVVLKTKQCILDYLGVAIGGAQSETGRKVIDSTAWMGAEGPATVLGTKNKASVLAASFANGTLSEVLELQDGWRFGNIHACVVIPAALALSDDKATDGKTALKAITCGYEVANRIAHTVHPNHLAKGYLPTGTAGTCGAAMTSALMMGLGRKESQEAVSIAGFTLPISTAENLWGGYSIKPFHSGQAAKEGVAAAKLAEQGFEACPLEGSPERGRGWCDITTGSVKYERLLQDIGKHFVISDVYFKVYPCCRHAHHAAEAAINLSKRLPENAGIEKVVVRTYDLAAHLLDRYPHHSDNQVAYQFSIPYVVAFALLNRNMNVFNYVVENLRIPEVMQLASKVEIVSDPELTAIYPNVTPSIVEVYGEGYTDSERCEIPKGDPREPVTPAELEQKFRDLTEPILGKEGAEELKAAVYNLENIDNISVIGDIMRKWLP